jgi:ribosomal protein L37AE/L43A
MLDDPLMEIYTKYLKILKAQKVELVCPECGEPDHGNRMNNIAWCMKCNLPLVPQSKELHRIRVVKKEKNPTFREDS